VIHSIFVLCFLKQKNHVRKVYTVCYCELIYCFSHLVGVGKTSSNIVLLALTIKPYFLFPVFVTNIAFMHMFHEIEFLVPFIVAPEMLYEGPSFPVFNLDHKNAT
jgi:hypothetical protein